MDILKGIPTELPRAALVTGGGRRLGRAMALALAWAGFDVAVHAHRSLDEAEAVAGEIRAGGRRASVLAADLRDEAATAALPARAAAGLGPIGLLVNNASTFARDGWRDAGRAEWDSHMEPNLRAPFVLSQGFARALPETARGVIVNMLDQRVWALTPHFMTYTLSKAGLWTLTRTLALALAPRIRVCAIGPGPVLPSLDEDEAAFRRRVARNPLGHGGAVEEICAALLAILALPSMTGQMIALDGGQHLQWGPG